MPQATWSPQHVGFPSLGVLEVPYREPRTAPTSRKLCADSFLRPLPPLICQFPGCSFSIPFSLPCHSSATPSPRPVPLQLSALFFRRFSHHHFANVSRFCHHSCWSPNGVFLSSLDLLHPSVPVCTTVVSVQPILHLSSH